MLKIKKGNSKKLKIEVKDQDGVTITNLATANEIRYMIKDKPDDTNANALISKTVGSGVEVDTPSTGFLRISLSATDTEALTTGVKYHAVQVEYSNDEIKEIDLSYSSQESNQVEIIQDVIRG